MAAWVPRSREVAEKLGSAWAAICGGWRVPWSERMMRSRQDEIKLSCKYLHANLVQARSELMSLRLRIAHFGHGL